MTNWLSEVTVSPTADAVRRSLSVIEFRHIQTAIEHLALITERPIAEVADRILVSMAQAEAGEGIGGFLGLIDDIVEEHER